MFDFLSEKPRKGPQGRFRIDRRLGAGSTGVVYAAWDEQRQASVALKTLHNIDADGIYHLKREFRSLADVSHTNLARLYELFGEVGQDDWFVTMELVEGADFITYVRADASWERLRRAFRQLVQGMDALHRAGKLHRDVKPSNVLVTVEGRVVLLDFGLVTDIALTQLFHTLEPKLVGTPAYLSPEQASGEVLGPATDYYAAGALLLEALTGRLPFEGTLLHVLRAKQSPPPSVRDLAPAAPSDLADLCTALLRVDPRTRPTATQILATLGGSTADPRGFDLPVATTWVGRAKETQSIVTAFEQACGGETVVLTLHGSSGVGKSALLRHALEAIANQPNTVVLAGRCYERELVPYRGLDSVIDALTRHLSRLSTAEVEALVPRDVDALTRLFPVLRRVQSFDRPRRRSLADDALRQRQRAWGALRELLGRLAVCRGLLVCIDDWQWGDEDSAALLLEMLHAPDAPPMLLLLCHRREDKDQSECLRVFHAGLNVVHAGGAVPQVLELCLDPLDAATARELAHRLLGADEAADDAANIVKEAGGNAFFLRTLVEHLRSQPNVHRTAAGVTLDQVLQERFARLDPTSQTLLEILAIAGRPLSARLANQATGLQAESLHASTQLREQHLLRSRGDLVEIDHDRIRDAVVARLSPAVQQEHHWRLVRTLQAHAEADPEILGFHLLAVGETQQAAEALATAGLKAQEGLAFERAVQLLQRALELYGPASEEGALLQAPLAQSLANVGRGAEAAQAFLAAASSAAPAAALDLRRRAAEQQLRIGQLDQGLATLAAVLDQVGETLAPTARRALLPLMLRRFRMRLRGLRYKEREASTLDPVDLVRLDVFWSASTALGIIDHVRAMDFQTRHLRLALQLGEPYRIARALALEAGYSAVGGTASTSRTEQLVRVAEQAASRVNQPFAQAWAALAFGMGNYLEGQHLEALRRCEQAESTFQGCVGVWWEMGSARLFSAWSLYYLGQWRELSRKLPVQISEAEARADLYTATSLSSSVLSIPWLMQDNPEGGARALTALMHRWSRTDFHALHYWQLVAECSFSLYQGHGDEAWARLVRDALPLRSSLLLRLQTARIELADLRGRILLSTGSRTLKQVVRIARDLDSENSLWARALASGLTAGVKAASGDRRAAVTGYATAAAAFSGANMQVHAAVSRLRAAQWAEGTDFSAEVAGAEATAWLKAQGVQNPNKIARLLAPVGPI